MRFKIFLIILIPNFAYCQYVKNVGDFVSYNKDICYYKQSQPSPVVPTVLDTAYIYMIMGQSNTGQSDANLINADSVKYRGLINRAFIFNGLTEEFPSLDELNVGVNTNIFDINFANPFPRGFSSEAVLGYQLSLYKNNDIYFYKYGVGASTLGAQWRKGKWMYDDAILQGMKAFIDTVYSQNHYPEIKAIIWIQGESDNVDSATYYGYLKQFFDSVSVDIGRFYSKKSLVFSSNYKKVITELKPTSSMYRPGVAAAQREYTKAGNSNNAIYINTVGVPFQSDSLHYSEQGHLQLGWKIFNSIKDY